MSTENPKNLQKKKTEKDIETQFKEITKTVSKMNIVKNKETKAFKIPNNPINIYRQQPINIHDNIQPDKHKPENNKSNTNNLKKIENTDFRYLINILKQKPKQNNNGEGILKKMDNSVKSFGSSNSTGLKNSGPSIGNKVKGFFKDFGSSNGTVVKNSGPSFGNKVKGLGKSIGSKVEGLGGLISRGYDSTKQFIVDKTNPEKNVVIDISNIKNITQLVKNDCIYIDITNLIGDYIFHPNLNEKKYFEDDTLLNTIIYSILSNNNNNKDNKNLIIYFTRNYNYNQKIYIYNVNENRQYIHLI